MTHDLYAGLAAQQGCPTSGPLPDGLASGFVDGCTAWFASNDIGAKECAAVLANEKDEYRRKQLQEKKRKHENAKNAARRCYIKRARAGALAFPNQLDLDPWPPQLLHADWLAVAVEFELLTPWYSKDDRPFHVLDNPVRKDRIFGVPFMAAASWKGMLRWACRMKAGLREHHEKGKSFEDWNDPDWVLHLFGNEKGEVREFSQGALVFYPTWFDKIGFEVINPHDRSRRAGTQPIYYEVVPGRRPKSNSANGHEEGGKGTLRLLYASWPGIKAQSALAEWLPNLLQAIEDLLTRYGISAKRTVGWGTAEIKNWRAWRKDTPADQLVEAKSLNQLLNKLGLAAGGGS